PWERELRGIYQRVLTLCNTEKAIREGGFFDLMYVNYNNQMLDPHRQFAFMRGADGEGLLIVANFADYDREVAVNLPRHAFEVLGLREGVMDARELLEGSATETRTVDAETPFATRVPAHGAVVWKLTAHKDEKKECKTSRKSKKQQIKTN
ncbi:MAG: hypothetical protein K2J97_05510, partial [Muribaculaceae bacterium]|nr:hypothetical protein [Muribaculaceae bacterium]